MKSSKNNTSKKIFIINKRVPMVVVYQKVIKSKKEIPLNKSEIISIWMMSRVYSLIMRMISIARIYVLTIKKKK